MSRGGTLIVRGLQASIHAAWILVILAMNETGVLATDAPSNGAPVKFGDHIRSRQTVRAMARSLVTLPLPTRPAPRSNCESTGNEQAIGHRVLSRTDDAVDRERASGRRDV